MVQRFTTLLLVISLINGQQNQIVEENPCDQATTDAKNDVEKWLWIEIGIRTGRFSSKLSESLVTNPKIENILNRSEGYINEYTECYKKEVKRLQMSYARTGLIGNCIVAATIVLLSIRYDYDKTYYSKNEEFKK